MGTDYTRGLCHRALCGFCLVVALRLQAGWMGNPPIENRYKEHEFLASCREGNCPAVKFYLEQGEFDSNTKYSSGLTHKEVTGLFVASQNGHTEVVSILVSARANLDWQCSDGASALFVASQNGHTEVVRTLVTAGGDVCRSRHDGTAPLFMASQNGHAEAVRALVTAGASINRRCCDGTTPLFIASQNGHTAVVGLLVAAGADLDRSGIDGTTPLFKASQNGHTEVTRTLVAAGADVDQSDLDGATPLFMASQNGHTEVVRILLEAGANPFISWFPSRPWDSEGKTPMAQAQRKKRLALPRSKKKRIYSEIISMLSQAQSRNLPAEESETDQQTDETTQLLSAVPQLSLRHKPA